VDILGAVTEVSAFTAQMGHRGYLPPDVEDNSVAILRFANGALGVIDSKWGQIGPPPVRTSYHGVQGTLINGASGTELYSTVDPALPEGWEPIELSAGTGSYRTPMNLHGWRAPVPSAAGAGRGGREQRYFVDCALNRRPVEGASSPRMARNAQEVIEAVYRSAESGRAVRLPLA
jgi:predicted dehydrogenase